jgi:hypothetical protein
LSNRKIRSLGVLGIFAIAFSPPSGASELTKRTAEAFEQYVQHTEARIRSEVADQERFLYFDSLAEKQRDSMLASLHSGHVIVQAAQTLDGGKEIEVPGGLVHHWLAIAFIPGAKLEQVLAIAQDYPHHAQFYKPDVQRAEILGREGQHFRVYYRFYRRAIVTAIYNTQFDVEYFIPDGTHGYCLARAVRIAEVEHPGKPEEKELPVGNDHGYMWRLNTYTRYQQKDDGVYIQIEFLALSRRVPAFFAWLVNPYIRSIPREYLTNYMLATQRALTAEAGREGVAPLPPKQSDEKSATARLKETLALLRFLDYSVGIRH